MNSRKTWKVEIFICKSFIWNEHSKLLLNALCAFNLFSRSTFRFYSTYQIVFYIIKQMCKICDKIISIKKYEKLKNCSFTMTNWIKLFLEKGSWCKIIIYAYFTKGHLDNSEGQVEVVSTLIGSYFSVTFDSN